jgi:hypothetical protein
MLKRNMWGRAVWKAISLQRIARAANGFPENSHYVGLGLCAVRATYYVGLGLCAVRVTIHKSTQPNDITIHNNISCSVPTCAPNMSGVEEDVLLLKRNNTSIQQRSFLY